MKGRLIDVFLQERMDEFENVILSNEEYRKIREEELQIQEKLDTMGLTAEQKAVVEELLAKANQSGAVYGKMAYEHGFRDGATLMCEIRSLT